MALIIRKGLPQLSAVPHAVFSGNLYGSDPKYSRRIFPKTPEQRLTTLDDVFSVSTVFGLKVIIVPDQKTAAYLGAGITLKAFEALGNEKATLGVSAGGTWEETRYALGMPEFSKNIFGMSLPVNRIPFVGSIDEYALHRSLYDKITDDIGSESDFIANRQSPWTFMGEHLLWMNAAGFNEEQYIGPPVRYEYADIEALRIFEDVLKKYFGCSLVQWHGIGINGHDGQCEPGDYDPVKEGFRLSRLTDATRIQNTGGFVPSFKTTGYLRGTMFRDVAAAYGLLTFNEIISKCQVLAASFHGDNVPDELSYVELEVYRDFMRSFASSWDSVLKTAKRVPAFGLTRGTGEMAHASDLHLFMATGGHKALAMKNVLEKPVSPRWPSSSLQTYPRSVVIIDSLAARLLNRNDMYFVFEADESTAEKISQFDLASLKAKFWDRLDRKG
ncbi:MAG: hypothetical protein NTZ10_00555 [Candidatus Saganbacteria bacterium]|nr:hypothetical protein [Candidatus Saganbacteria bacterium]